MPAEGMKMKHNGLFANGLIWFGAATSIAEMEAGSHCRGNLTAVLLGHALGCALLFATGLIGARTRQSAMETTTDAFGPTGSRFFAALNCLQLVGWASVMIAMGATAATHLFHQVGYASFCVIIGLLAAASLVIGLRESAHVSIVVIALLAGLALILTRGLLTLPCADELPPALPFAQAFELSVAMPLSWLPLISDYTKDAERPAAASFVSALVYSLTGVWMYVLGMMIAGTGPEAGVASAIIKTGIGIAGLLIVILSTGISAFFDAYSTGESCRTVFRHCSAKAIGILTCAVAVILALQGVMDRYTGFLRLIASVFAPMAAALLVSHYLVRRRRSLLNLMAWGAGILTYQFADSSPLGPTVTAILVSSAFAFTGKVLK